MGQREDNYPIGQVVVRLLLWSIDGQYVREVIGPEPPPRQ